MPGIYGLIVCRGRYGQKQGTVQDKPEIMLCLRVYRTGLWKSRSDYRRPRKRRLPISSWTWRKTFANFPLCTKPLGWDVSTSELSKF